MSGYARLHEKIHENPLFKVNPIARHVFMDLLAMNPWSDRTLDWKGKPVSVGRGQIMMSSRQLAKFTGYSHQQIRTALGHMLNYSILEINTGSNTVPSIITLCNYDKYHTQQHTPNTRDNTQPTQSQHTTEEVEEKKERNSVSEELTLVETVEPVPVSKVPIKEAVDLWNETASRCGLPQVQRLTAPRKAKLRTRLKTYSIDDWRSALAGIEKSEFLCGEVEGKTWRADFDWLVRNDEQIDKILSGKYGNGRHASTPEGEMTDDLRQKIFSEYGVNL